MIRWGRFSAAYAGLAVLATALAAYWRNGSPLVYPEPWLELPARMSHTYSLLLGLLFGFAIVLSTRMVVPRFLWARRLHSELRPIARSISGVGIVVLAALSSLGEELLFRGLLQPWLGLIVQSLVFGIVHQIRGPSRWVWVSWATGVGLGLGAIFQLTGSLLGPLAAHALINGLNLLYLRNHDPEPQRRSLGGLLGQRG
ncbi:MAG TPA: CPBP family intramembrane glutamic endopeptidase [Polyangiaceae bacterium]|nr:CPBP family intramembrane glutamic endopeptidase [Polyangiaceae bacterium]